MATQHVLQISYTKRGMQQLVNLLQLQRLQPLLSLLLRRPFNGRRLLRSGRRGLRRLRRLERDEHPVILLRRRLDLRY